MLITRFFRDRFFYWNAKEILIGMQKYLPPLDPLFLYLTLNGCCKAPETGRKMVYCGNYD
jgi:hypothetical protein